MSDNIDFDSANDAGGPGDTLSPMEALDSDEIRNDDGDNVVDPPDQWIEVEESDSLDDKLAAEVPDATAAPAADDASTGDTVELTDDQIDHVVPGDTGTDAGQVSGTPEDGDSFFTVVE
jgi:hypothetical protein